MQITLSARPPFVLSAVIRSHGWAWLAPFRTEDDSRTLRYVDRLSSGRVVELRIGPIADGVTVEAEADLSAAERDEVTSQVGWMLGLEQDLASFYSRVRGEPKLFQAEPQGRGRFLRAPTLFEDTVKTIATTNTTWAATIRMIQALVAGYGDPLPADPSRRAFPTAQRLAQVDPEQLRSTARLGYRSGYVVELARAVTTGTLDLEGFKSAFLSTPELRRALLKIKGVGDYAAANLLMLLGRCDFVPVDTWALKLVSHEWHGGEPVGRADVEAAFEKWGEWKALAYWFWDWAYAG